MSVEAHRHGDEPSIDALVFPGMFICERVEGDPASSVRKRRLVNWHQLDRNSLNRKYRFPDDDKLVDVSPIRFVGACEHGHIDDIDWRWAVHGAEKCTRPMYLEEKGTSGSPADTAIACECGKRITLQETNIPGRLGPCQGRRPWLGRDKEEACGNKLKILTRTATNTYFAQVATVISLPQGNDALAKSVDVAWTNLSTVNSLEVLKTLFAHVPAVRGALVGQDLECCFAHIQSRQRDEIGNSSASPRIAEFDLLASGADTIGNPGSDSRLYAVTLARSEWERPSRLNLSFFKNVVGVHRLREVSCLYGFTRFEPAPRASARSAEHSPISFVIRDVMRENSFSYLASWENATARDRAPHLDVSYGLSRHFVRVLFQHDEISELAGSNTANLGVHAENISLSKASNLLSTLP